jgi:hypothetical protein
MAPSVKKISARGIIAMLKILLTQEVLLRPVLFAMWSPYRDNLYPETIMIPAATIN